MDYANLGRSGLKVSPLCLGMMTYGTPEWRKWILDEEQARPIIRRAIEAGINFFDTADMYSRGLSEEILGRAVRDFTRREQVVIATKVYFPMSEGANERGLSRLHILRAVEDSLRRLGTDYIDLYQIHRYDAETPIEETLEALHHLVKSGKVRYIGASSMYAWQFARSLYLADLHRWTRFASMQNHYNLVYREEEREMIPLCISEGVAVIPWSPLARGFLAGNRRPAGSQRPAGGKKAKSASPPEYGDTIRAQTDDFAQSMYFQEDDFRVVARAADLAAQRGLSTAQVALAWLLHKPGVAAPIIGASKMQHLEEALAAVKVQLSKEEIAALEEPYRPHPVLGHS